MGSYWSREEQDYMQENKLVTQITVGIKGAQYYMYLDSSEQKLLYDPVLYDPAVGVDSNLTTAFTLDSDYLDSPGTPFPFRSLVTPMASPKLTAISGGKQQIYGITMEITNGLSLFAEQQRAGHPYALYFSDSLMGESSRFYIQPRLTSSSDPRERFFQAVKKERPSASDYMFEFIPATVKTLSAN